MKKCSNCGCENDDNSKFSRRLWVQNYLSLQNFCPECGTELNNIPGYLVLNAGLIFHYLRGMKCREKSILKMNILMMSMIH